jgi:hypothetical protein
MKFSGQFFGPSGLLNRNGPAQDARSKPGSPDDEKGNPKHANSEDELNLGDPTQGVNHGKATDKQREHASGFHKPRTTML